MATRQTTLRLPLEIFDRVEALVGPLTARPDGAAYRIDQTAVLRLAVFRGLADIERELSTPEPAAKPAAKRRR